QRLTFGEVDSWIETFADLIDVPSHEVQLQRLEYGVNMEMKWPLRHYFDRILLHRKKCPERYDDNGIWFNHRRYRLKLYAKGGLLRVEVHIKHVEILRKQGIQTLHDLHDLAAWKRLGKYLLSLINDLIIH